MSRATSYPSLTLLDLSDAQQVSRTVCGGSYGAPNLMAMIWKNRALISEEKLEPETAIIEI